MQNNSNKFTTHSATRTVKRSGFRNGSKCTGTGRSLTHALHSRMHGGQAIIRHT
jgi:hypothetical protein